MNEYYATKDIGTNYLAPPTALMPNRYIDFFCFLVNINIKASPFCSCLQANNTVLTMLLSRGAPFTVCNILCTGNIIGNTTQGL